MDLVVQWSDRAESELDYILNYWNDRNGSRRYSLRLISLVNDTIDKLAKNPESGRRTNNLFIRYRIVKDYFLYYSYDDTNLYIVDICDMRRDPKYIKSLLD